MKRNFLRNILPVAALLFGATLANAQDSGTSTLSVTVSDEASITITTGSTSLTNSGSNFSSSYTGTTSFSYKIRTTEVNGSGAITLKVTSDFAAGGPDGDELGFTCIVDSPGTACSPSTASTTGEINVANFGTNAHSADAGNSGNSVSWTLANKPSYKTGSYSATVTFTITSV